MRLRRLGNSGLKVSEIGLGGNSFGATVDGDEAVTVIRKAIDCGITFIDTADIYTKGRSEELVGKAVAGRRDSVVIASKAGHPMRDDAYGRGLSRRWIITAVEDSLRRLGTDYLDLYQAHTPDADTPMEETLRAMDDLVTQGKVRYIGGSNYKAWQLVDALRIAEREHLHPWVSMQPRWNILEGLDDPHLLEVCGKFGVGMIPYTPLASGMLTGKYRVGQEPPKGTRAGDLPRVRTRLTDQVLTAVDRLRPWCEERGHTTAELGIAWLLAFPEVSTVIVGARNAEQIEANVRAAEWVLSTEEREEAESIARGA